MLPMASLFQGFAFGTMVHAPHTGSRITGNRGQHTPPHKDLSLTVGSGLSQAAQQLATRWPCQAGAKVLPCPDTLHSGASAGTFIFTLKRRARARDQ